MYEYDYILYFLSVQKNFNAKMEIDLHFALYYT